MLEKKDQLFPEVSVRPAGSLTRLVQISITVVAFGYLLFYGFAGYQLATQPESAEPSEVAEPRLNN